ncbi:MAG TPA: hypothetical protein VGO67_26065 [Verrucomicrobiae bacterium]|jgi:hypothetical protein
MKPTIILCLALALMTFKLRALELAIESSKTVLKSSEAVSFVVTFHNNSTNNVLLSCGAVLGNGQQSWNSLEAELKNEAGQQIPMTLHWGVGAVSGRIYFLGLPLRAGSSYGLLVNPNDYYVGGGECLKPGKYEINFAFHGKQPSSTIRDSTQMPACWEGEVRSNTLKFEVLAE